MKHKLKQMGQTFEPDGPHGHFAKGQTKKAEKKAKKDYTPSLSASTPPRKGKLKTAKTWKS